MEKQFKEIIFYALVTSVCCIILGLIIFQGNVFSRTHYAFQFVAFGIIGSLFFHTLRLASVKVALIVLAGLILADMMYNRSADFPWVLRDLIFGVSLGSAIYLFFAIYYTQRGMRGAMTPITLGALLAATNLVATLALVFLNDLPVLQNYPTVLLNVMLGFLIGFGIGAGILVSVKAGGAFEWTQL